MLTKATAFEKSAKDKKLTPVFGIDLGTTNSAISVIAVGDAPSTIQLIDGKMTMPSCVMYKDGEFVVGWEAYIHRGEPNVVYSVKRLMQTPDAKVDLTCSDGSTVSFTPAQISAEILKGLVEKTGGMYGDIKDVVVTVPAYFDQNGVNATREACELAGLNLISIANEPTAASLCYQLEPEEGSTKDVLVYDLGGGTFDVTLMRIQDNVSAEDSFESLYGDPTESSDDCSKSVVTLGIRGDMLLGGDDIDDELLSIVLNRLQTEHNVDVSKLTKGYLEQLKLRLEQYKKNSINDLIVLHIDTDTIDGEHVNEEVAISGVDFAESARRIFVRTKVIVDDLLSSVSNEAKTIVLTGGSTKNQWIQRALAEAYPDFHIDNALSPDLSVSQGAAIQGRVTKFGDSSVQIFDILPLTIGVLVEDGNVAPLVKGGTPLPVTKNKVFTTQHDNQEVVEVTLMQGNSVNAEECVNLGKLRIDGIKPLPAGEADLLVTIIINANRLMRCIAKVDGIEKEIQLDLSGETTTGKSIQLSKFDKTLARLAKAGSQMTERNRDKLLAMIREIKAGNSSCSIDDIKKFIAENRNGEIS